MKRIYLHNIVITTFMVSFFAVFSTNAAEDRYIPKDNDAIYTNPSFDPRYQQYYQQPAQPNQQAPQGDSYYYPTPSQDQILLQQQYEIQLLREQQRLLEQRLREQELQQKEKENYPLYYY